ncbi:hypothetical protein HZH68_009726 [Vespula germanica]|uniref:Uncharacterized protein n=1 Tax=Vespula germanica TaxID=30212 RepID=A0A834JWD6_VESGE|nr:hypothetical protein HZH68_009726 [Vespula germanica]
MEKERGKDVVERTTRNLDDILLLLALSSAGLNMLTWISVNEFDSTPEEQEEEGGGGEELEKEEEKKEKKNEEEKEEEEEEELDLVARISDVGATRVASKREGPVTT